MKKTAILIFALIFIGCAKPQFNTVPLENQAANFVGLRHCLTETTNSGRYYNHPQNFSPSDIRFELDRLILRQFKWGKLGLKNKWVPRPVFPDDIKDQLASDLVLAFQKAAPSGTIQFNTPGRMGGKTSGEVYIEENRMIWVFKKVDGHLCTGKDKFWLDDKDWSIEELEGLKVFKDEKKKIVTVTRDLSITQKELKKLEREEETYSEKENPSVVQTPEEVSTVQDLEKKLETLKQWKEKGLISEKEYLREKELVLEKLQAL